MDEQILKDFVATAEKYNYDWNAVFNLFPELKSYDQQLLKDYTATAKKYNYDWSKANSYFPEFGFGQQQPTQQTVQPTQQQPIVKKKDDMESDWLFGDGSSESEPSKTEPETDVFSRAQKVLGIKQPVKEEQQVERPETTEEASATWKRAVKKEPESLPEYMQGYIPKKGEGVIAPTKLDFVGRMTPELVKEATPKFLEEGLSALTPSQFWQFGPDGAKETFEYYFKDAGFRFETEGNNVKAISPSGEIYEYNTKRAAYPNNRMIDEFKNFIRESAFKNPEIADKAYLYEKENKKFKTKEEINNEVKTINAQEEQFNGDYKKFLNLKKDIEDIEADLKRWRDFGEQNTPKYIQTEAYLNERKKELQDYAGTMDSKAKVLEAQQTQLDKAVGKYTEFQATQGTFGGTLYRAIAETSSNIFSQFLRTAISKTADTMPLSSVMGEEAYQDALNKKLKEKGYGDDKVVPIEILKEAKAEVEAEIGAEARNDFKVAARTGKYKGEQLNNVLTINDVRESIKDVLTAPISTTSEYKQKREEEGGFIERGVIGLAGSLPAMVGGRYVRYMNMFMMTTDAAMQEMDNNPNFAGISENEKELVALPIGVVGAALEEIGFRGMVKGKAFTSYILKTVLGRVPANATASTIRKTTFDVVAEMGIRAGTAYAGGVLSEMETGLLQQVNDYAVKDIYSAMKGKKMFDNPAFLSGQYLYDVWDASRTEGVGAGVVSVPYSIAAAYKKDGFQALDDATFKIFEDLAKDNESRKFFVTSLKNKINLGEVTPNQGKQMLEAYDQASGMIGSVPDEITDPQSRKIAMDLMSERKRLEQQKYGKDDALAKPIQDKINQINEQLSKLTEDAIQKQAAGEVSLQPETEPGKEMEAGGSEAGSQAAPKQGILSPEEKEKLTQNRRVDLFPEESEFADVIGGSGRNSSLSDYNEVNGVGIASYTNPDNGLVDVIMSGTSDNDYVGYVRVYENGKPTNRWTSKMSNESGNKENFKTMISEVQARLPENHEYTEKTNISIDGVRVYSNQLNRGYEILTDANGNPVTNTVTLNAASVEGLQQAATQEEKQSLYDNMTVTTREQFNALRDKITALMPNTRVLWNQANNTVQIQLPVLVQSGKAKTEQATVTQTAESIEKRRQAELDKLPNGGIVTQGDVITTSKEADEINAKYDAELAALQPTPAEGLGAQLETVAKEEQTPTEVTPVEQQFTEQDRARKAELEEAMRKADKRRKNITVGETTMPKAEAKAELDALVQKEQAVQQPAAVEVAPTEVTAEVVERTPEQEADLLEELLTGKKKEPVVAETVTEVKEEEVVSEKPKTKKSNKTNTAETKKADKEKPAISNTVPTSEKTSSTAASLGGVAYELPSGVAIIQVFNLFGQPIYIGYKNGTYTRIDIDSFDNKNNVFTEQELNDLKNLKKEIENQENKNESDSKNPFTEQGRVAATDSVPNNIKQFVENLTKALGINKKIFIITDNDFNEGQYKKHGLFGTLAAIRSAILGAKNPFEFGSKRYMSDADAYYIYYDGKLKGSELFSVVSHEIGHIIEQELFKNASKETVEAIKNDYNNWVAKLTGKTLTEVQNETRDITIQHLLQGNVSMFDPSVHKYISSFSEYLADNVAKWARTSQKPKTLVDKFFSNLVNEFKKIRDYVFKTGNYSENIFKWLDELYDVKAEKEITTPKKLADAVRKNLKIKGPGGLQSNILGIPVAIWNAGVETVAKSIEVGMAVNNAIKRGINYIKEKHGKKINEVSVERKMLIGLYSGAIQTAREAGITEEGLKTYLTRKGVTEEQIETLLKYKKRGDKKPISKEKITSKPKPKKVTVNDMTALKDQIKLEVKAAREGAKSVSDAVKAIVEYFNSIKDRGNLTRKDLINILGIVSKVNSQKTLDNAANKIFEIIGKAKTDIIEVSEYKALVNQIKLEAKAAKEGKKQVRDAVKEIVRLFNKSKVITKLTRSDLSKIINLMDKVYDDASLQKAVGEMFDIILKSNPNLIEVSKTKLAEEFKKKVNAGIRQGKKDLNTKRKELTAAIKEMKKKGSISVRQAKALINRVNAVNLDNPVMVERLLTYAENIFNDADYDTRIQEVRKLQEKVKKVNHVSMRDTVREFASINPERIPADKLLDYIQALDDMSTMTPFYQKMNDMFDEVMSYKSESKEFDAIKTFQALIDKLESIAINQVKSVEDYVALIRDINSFKRKAYQLLQNGDITQEQYDQAIENVGKDQAAVEKKYEKELAALKEKLVQEINGLKPEVHPDFTPEEAALINKYLELSDDDLKSLSPEDLYILNDLLNNIKEDVQLDYYRLSEIVSKAYTNAGGQKLAEQLNESKFNKSTDEGKKLLLEQESAFWEGLLGLGRAASGALQKFIVSPFNRAIASYENTMKDGYFEFSKLKKKYKMKDYNMHRLGMFATYLQEYMAQFDSENKNVKDIGTRDWFGEIISNSSMRNGYKSAKPSLMRLIGFGDTELKTIEKIYNSLPKDANGKVDPKAVYDSFMANDGKFFTKKEKAFFDKIMDWKQKNLTTKQKAANEMNGMPFKEIPFHMMRVRLDRGTKQISPKAEGGSGVVRIEAGTGKERASQRVGPIMTNFEQLFSENLEQTARNYYLKEAINDINNTLSVAKKELKGKKVGLFDTIPETISEALNFEFDKTESQYLASNLLAARAAETLLNPIRTAVELTSTFLSYPFRAKTPQGYKELFGKQGQMKKLLDFTSSPLRLRENINKAIDISDGRIKPKGKFEKALNYLSGLPERTMMVTSWMPTFNNEFKDITGVRFDMDKFKSDAAYRQKYGKAIKEAAAVADAQTEKIIGSTTKAGGRREIRIAPKILANVFGAEGTVKKNTTAGQILGFFTNYPYREVTEFLNGFREAAEVYKQGGGALKSISQLQKPLGVTINLATYGFLSSVVYAMKLMLLGDDEDEEKGEATLKELMTLKGFMEELEGNAISLAASKYAAGGKAILQLTATVAYNSTSDEERKAKIKKLLKNSVFVEPIDAAKVQGYGGRNEVLGAIASYVPQIVLFAKRVEETIQTAGELKVIYNKFQEGGLSALSEDEGLAILAIDGLLKSTQALFNFRYGTSLPMYNDIKMYMKGVKKEAGVGDIKLSGTENKHKKALQGYKNEKEFKENDPDGYLEAIDEGGSLYKYKEEQSKKEEEKNKDKPFRGMSEESFKKKYPEEYIENYGPGTDYYEEQRTPEAIEKRAEMRALQKKENAIKAKNKKKRNEEDTEE